MMDTRDQLHLFDKSKLKSLEKSRESLMPAYDEKMLPEKDLRDLVAFLVGLEASAGGEARGRRAVDLVGGQFSGRMGLGAGGGAHRLQTAQSMGHPTSFSRIGVGRRSEWNDFASGSRTVKTNAAIILIAVVMALSLCGTATAQVTPQRLLESAKEPQNWLMYSGDYAGHRHSALDQITVANANALVPKWAYQTMAGGKFETTSLVVDGVLYGTGQDDRAYALDARTGRPIWQYQRALPADIRPCCGRVNRGLAILGDKVFMGTLDAHVIALDAKTGNVMWDVTAADYRGGYSFTLAPLAIRNLVILGVSGGEYGIRGFIDAYDATTGERKWRFNTMPGPGEPGHETWEADSWKIGGAPAWITGTFDPATNTTFWTTGNPSPSNRGIGRAGDNLYSNTLLALDPDTGKLKWHFQFTKHDDHDYDATQVPVMIDRRGASI